MSLRLSVGLLYSGGELLRLIHDHRITAKQVREMFRRFHGADINAVSDMTQTCGWFRVDTDGSLRITQRGMDILSIGSPEGALRAQLLDYVFATRPPWAALASRGREETLVYLDADVLQCLEEAGLLHEWDEGLIQWWDLLADAGRGQVKNACLEVGREGERLSRDYERERTGRTPKWLSLDSNLVGYDLLSQVSRDSDAGLRIEVKATTAENGYASFHISRNEWNVAMQPIGGEYLFHLWLLRGVPQLFVIPPTKIIQHIPADKGEGLWESVEVIWHRLPQALKESTRVKCAPPPVIPEHKSATRVSKGGKSGKTDRLKFNRRQQGSSFA